MCVCRAKGALVVKQTEHISKLAALFMRALTRLQPPESQQQPQQQQQQEQQQVDAVSSGFVRAAEEVSWLANAAWMLGCATQTSLHFDSA